MTKKLCGDWRALGHSRINAFNRFFGQIIMLWNDEIKCELKERVVEYTQVGIGLLELVFEYSTAGRYEIKNLQGVLTRRSDQHAAHC